MDLNCTFYLHNGEPVNPHARRPYAGHGAHTVGGGFDRWPPRAQHKCASALDPNWVRQLLWLTTSKCTSEQCLCSRRHAAGDTDETAWLV